MTERDFAIEVVEKLQRAGFQALWAGGCVRDERLGLVPHDYDVATNAHPEQVMKLFRRSIAVGAAFGVIEVIGPRGPHRQHLTVEVATFRSDGAYTDGRRPDSVTFSSPKEDAQRRDFTINGMFFDPIAKQLHDFVGGQADLDSRILRAIGAPLARFTEDKLRVLRAVRIAARFDLAIDPATLAAARQIAPEITVVSAERIAEELRRMLAHPRRARGLHLLREFHLIAPLFPELAGSAEPLERVVKQLNPEASFELAFAGIVVPLAKRQVEAIANRLKLANDEKGRIAWLVENREALVEAPNLRMSRLKPILVHEGIEELLALHRAEALADGRDVGHVEFCERMLHELPPEVLDPPPAVKGEDLIAAGLKPGPEFKRLLDAVREAQLDGQIRTKADGLKLIAELRAPPPGV